MNTIKIYYHNPLCSKSRKGLLFLESDGVLFELKHYLEEPLTEDELRHIFETYEGCFRDLIRKKEALEYGMDLETLTVDELINDIIQYPILLERPLLVDASTVIIGRPPEKLMINSSKI